MPRLKRQVSTWSDLKACLQRIWAYLTENWLVRRGQRTKTRRKVVDASWKPFVELDISSALHGGCETVLRKRVETIAADAIPQLGGYAALTLAGILWRGGTGPLEDHVPSMMALAEKYAQDRDKPSIEQRARERVARWHVLTAEQPAPTARLPGPSNFPANWPERAVVQIQKRRDREKRYKEAARAAWRP
jgi:hypothetical protein